VSESSAERLEQLERQVDRERDARREAERIAERGMTALREDNAELDRRIAERMAALDVALAEAEAASAALRSVLVSLSHSLSTPLNGVRGMLELLKEAAIEEPARSWHASASRSALRLDRLVQRLVRYVELENCGSPATTRETPVRAVLFEIEERWAGRLAKAGQLLVVDSGPAAGCAIGMGDELLFVFDELLHNVMVHADPGHVRLSSVVSESGEIGFEITDPGPGFPAIDARALISSGDRLASAGDHGSQLGLVMVERILEGLGGGLQFDPQRPTTVVLRLAADHEVSSRR